MKSTYENKIIYGIHTITAIFKHTPKRFKEVFISIDRKDQRFLTLAHALQSKGICINLVHRQYLDKISRYAVHQGIVAYVKLEQQYSENDLLDLITKIDNPFLLILDGITDPHNLGACLRCADGAGVHAVIIPKNRSAHLNATVNKVACGATENIPLVRVTNLARFIRQLKEKKIWIVGTTSHHAHRSLYYQKIPNRVALVMGSEGKGIRRLVREQCDELINIPLKNGSISSLNVSVATGICLFEIVRQRKIHILY